MLLARTIALGAFSTVLFGFTPTAGLERNHTEVLSQKEGNKEKPKKTRSGIDYTGMLPLEDWKQSPIRLATTGREPLMAIKELLGKNELKVRLTIKTDGTISKSVYLEGNKRLMQIYSKVFSNFKFTATPDAVPGPWELDMTIITSRSDNTYEHGEGFGIRTDPNYTKQVAAHIDYKPISYRTAVQ